MEVLLNYTIMKKSKKVYALYLTVAFFFSLFSFGKIYASIDVTGAVEYNATTTGSAGTSPWTLNTHVFGCGTAALTNGHSYEGFYGSDPTNLTRYGGTTSNANCKNGYYTFGGTNEYTSWNIYTILDTNASTTGMYYILYCANANGVTNICSTGANNYPLSTSTPPLGLTSYVKFYWDGTTATTFEDAEEEIDYTTHFTDTEPDTEETLINPNVTISANWIISSTDLLALDTVISSPANKIRVRAWVTDIEATNQASIVKVIDYVLPTGYETSTSTTVLFNGTTIGLNYGRNYRLTFNLNASNYYGLFGTVFNINKTVYFSVGSTTESGHIQQSIASSTALELQESQYANGYSLSACNPLSGDWNVVDCVLSMFLPDNDFTARKLGEMSDTVTNSWPIGYITDFVRIISTTTIGTLTPIDATLPTGLPGAGSHITLDFTNVLDPVLNATTSVFVNSSAPSTDTFFEITNEYWKKICYLLAVAYILARIMGSHLLGVHKKQTKTA